MACFRILQGVHCGCSRICEEYAEDEVREGIEVKKIGLNLYGLTD